MEKDQNFSGENIHKTACVSQGAVIHPSAEVGPFCVVGPQVKLSAGVKLHSHVVIERDTIIGEKTEVFPFAVLGSKPQSLQYKDQPTKLIIGSHNSIHEYVTIHRGTEEGGGITQIGDNGIFMVACHIAHDCQIGNNAIMANNATLGGHVKLGDFVYVGGLSAVHPGVRIGSQAILGGLSAVEGNVIPYGSVMGERAKLCGLNIIGMKRRGLKRDDIHELRAAYRMLFANEGTMKERLVDVQQHFKGYPLIDEILNFMMEESKRPFCLPKGVVVHDN